jgi:hypothetical protein
MSDATSSDQESDPAQLSAPEDAIKAAGSPFNNKRGDADAVLRSSDKVEFFVHKEILSLSFTVFDKLLRLPGDKDDIRDDLPVVQLDEPSSTLDTVLRLTYRKSIPSNLTLAEITSALDSLKKYGMVEISYRVQSLVDSIIDTDPFGAYVISAAYELNTLAERAALSTLKLPLSALDSPLLASYPAKDYRKLIRFRIQTEKTLKSRLSSTSWLMSMNGLTKASAARLYGSPCVRCYVRRRRWYIHKLFEKAISHCTSDYFSVSQYKNFSSCRDMIIPQMPDSTQSCSACRSIRGEILDWEAFLNLIQFTVDSEINKVELFLTYFNFQPIITMCRQISTSGFLDTYGEE